MHSRQHAARATHPAQSPLRTLHGVIINAEAGTDEQRSMSPVQPLDLSFSQEQEELQARDDSFLAAAGAVVSAGGGQVELSPPR